MTERPILFSGPMVRAILSGQKTVTRRLVKGGQIPTEDKTIPADGPRWSAIGQRHIRYGYCVFGRTETECAIELGSHGVCPYGKPGDRLWVRETWSDVNLRGAPGIAYRADDDIRDLMAEPSFHDEDGAFNYDDKRVKPYSFCCWSEDLIGGIEGRWRPSIHMPRWVSRILLEITAVRVERLQDITEQQAEAEGVERPENITNVDVWDGPERELFNAMNQPRARFVRLWGDINGPESWAANSWVWVVEFKRVELTNV